jgi:arylsulfatase A-like enzyme
MNQPWCTPCAVLITVSGPKGRKEAVKEIAPDKPFFVYYVPGGTHAPHHPTPEWIVLFMGFSFRGYLNK